MTRERVEQQLTVLKLGRIRQVYAAWIEQAGAQQLGYGDFLEQLLNEEVVARQENQLRRRMTAAGFPYAATLEQFDFTLRPELKRPVLSRYCERAFVEQAGALVLVGASGLGKTHLAIAVGTRMVQLGYSVRFVTEQAVANAVLAAETRLARARVLEPLVRCQVLILDELGYLPLDAAVGPALYEIVAGRYERGGDGGDVEQEPGDVGRVSGRRQRADDGAGGPPAAPRGSVLFARHVIPNARQGGGRERAAGAAARHWPGGSAGVTRRRDC